MNQSIFVSRYSQCEGELLNDSLVLMFFCNITFFLVHCERILKFSAMKKITLIVVLLSVAYGVNAQFKYYSTGKLTFGDITVPAEYTTAWEGRGHYYLF